jgi:hypothetical protein
MKGLWKETLGGYNHKGDKRKTQSRKHHIKDNFNFLINKYYKDKRANILAEIENITKHSANIEVFDLLVTNVDSTKYCVIQGYQQVDMSNDIWYNINTNEPITDIILEVTKTYNKYICFKENVNISYVHRDNSNIVRIKNSYIFIYGKPYVNIQRLSICEVKSRKPYQNIANRKSRQRVKEWIHKIHLIPHKNILEDDIEFEIRNFHEEKTIAWMIC